MACAVSIFQKVLDTSSLTLICIPWFTYFSLFLFLFISEKYQGKFKECTNCDARIDLAAKGKYNYRDSKDFYHFCTGKCLEEYKSNQKPYCLSCNKSEIEGEGVLAPVGSKEFHNFCDQKCLDAYSIKVGKKSNSGKKSY